jgi:hypothetical protein
VCERERERESGGIKEFGNWTVRGVFGFRREINRNVKKTT